MDTTERIINAGLKGAIFGAFVMILYFGIKALHSFFSKENNRNDSAEKSGNVVLEEMMVKKIQPPMKVSSPFEPKKNENEIWAAALENYEVNRDLGLYARLYAEHKGDEQKVKAEYLSIKYEELKNEELEKARKIVEQGILDEKNSVMQLIKTSAYEVKKLRSSVYWLLWNGRVAVPSPKGNYGVYSSEALAVDAIDHFESYGQYKTKGLEFILSSAELSAYEIYFGEKPRKANNRKLKNPNHVDRVSKRKES